MFLSFGFWQKWLLAVSLYIVVLGFVLAFFGQSAPVEWAFNNRIGAVFWPDGVEPETLRYQAWIYALLGATLMGWGLCLVFLTCYPFANREAWAWQCIAAAMTLWFVVDTSASLYHGVAENAAFNTLLYALVMAPLIFARKQFFVQTSS